MTWKMSNSMQIIIVGCGRAGAELANRLSAAGHLVTVIDVRESAFDNLSPDFRGHVIEGEVLSRNVLLNAGVDKSDAFAALTNSDALNAVVGHMARTIYKVPNVVVRNYDPRWQPLHQAFGLPSVSSVMWNADKFIDLLMNREGSEEARNVTGDIGIYEFEVPAEWMGRHLDEMVVAGEGVAIAVHHNGAAKLPQASQTLHRGDIVHVSTTPDGAKAIGRRLGAEVH